MSKENKLPFRPARLGDRKGDLSKSWYIEYSAWDAQLKKLRRKFDYEINQYKTEKERRAFAKIRIEEINQLLTKGYHFDAEKIKKQDQERQYPRAADAYLWVLQRKRPELSRPTYNSYSSTIHVFNEWINTTRYKNYSINRLTPDICYQFIDELSENEVSPRTINSRYISYLRSFHNYYIKRNQGKGVRKDNPWLQIEKKKEVLSSMHVPFLEIEKQQLKKIISQKDPELWLFIQFIYYCYLRPNEVRQLQKYNIMTDRGMIFIDAPKAKNKKNAYITIPKHFREELQNFVEKKSSREFLFPGKWNNDCVGKNHMYNRFQKYLKRFDFGAGHTFYSWKHTGVVDAYKAGIDIKSLQAQLRHYSLEETDVYLRNLGLFDNDAILERFPRL